MTLMQMSGSSITTGGGAIVGRVNAACAFCVLFLIGSAPVQATTSTPTLDLTAEQTDSHYRAPVYSSTVLSTSEAIMEVRRRSGLTWEELGELFEVSRRSVHNWASGEVLASRNERHLRLVLDAIRHLDRGEARLTRDALLMTHTAGASAFGLLKTGDVISAVALAGAGTTIGNTREPLSETAKQTRSRLRAANSLDAVNAPPALSSGKSRVARVRRT